METMNEKEVEELMNKKNVKFNTYEDAVVQCHRCKEVYILNFCSAWNCPYCNRDGDGWEPLYSHKNNSCV